DRAGPGPGDRAADPRGAPPPLPRHPRDRRADRARRGVHALAAARPAPARRRPVPGAGRRGGRAAAAVRAGARGPRADGAGRAAAVARARRADLPVVRRLRLVVRPAGRAQRGRLRRARRPRPRTPRPAMNTAYGLAGVLLVAVATVLIGVLGRISRTTSDFYVASRTVTPLRNASAIGGEYLSAASFLGIAGLILAYGADMLWLPVGWTGGYLILLVLVSAPLRRSGAYTLPDFAEARLESMAVRRVASVLVVLISWLYLLPQFQSAGLVLRTVTGAPVWSGGVLVAVVVAVNVLVGGMRSVTLVQAFQYWMKLTALAVPLVFLLLAWRYDGAPGLSGETPPQFSERTTVSVGLAVTVEVTDPVRVVVDGVVDGRTYEETPVVITPGVHHIAQNTAVTFPAGAEVPHVSDRPATTDHEWAMPLDGRPHSLYATYSLILATFLGTMGLPHVLVRFYTNPDGRAARRTTVMVLSLLGAFYLLPAVYGALGRLYTPELLMTGRADAVVLTLPGRLIGGLGGDLLGALVTGGAVAAFLSTSSGITV